MEGGVGGGRRNMTVWSEGGRQGKEVEGAVQEHTA